MNTPQTETTRPETALLAEAEALTEELWRLNGLHETWLSGIMQPFAADALVTRISQMLVTTDPELPNRLAAALQQAEARAAAAEARVERVGARLEKNQVTISDLHQQVLAAIKAPMGVVPDVCWGTYSTHTALAGEGQP